MSSLVKTYIGFDYGTKKIGIAQANQITSHATALETLHYQSDEQLWQSLDKLMEQWHPNEIILGIPTLLDEKKSPTTELALEFSKNLTDRYSLTIHHVDERLTSIEAKDIIKQQRQAGKKKKTKKGDIDRIAACLILQQWLNALPN